MLSRPHGSGVDVHVRVYFNGSDLQSCHLQQKAGGRGYMREFQSQVVKMGLWGQTDDPLSNTTDDTTGNNDVLCHDD